MARFVAFLRVRTSATRHASRWRRRGTAVVLLAVGLVAFTACDPLSGALQTVGNPAAPARRPHNRFGDGLAAATPTPIVPRNCETDGCVSVDATRPIGAFRAKASGLLGTDIFPENTNLLQSLHLSWWRLSTFGLPGGPKPPNYRAFDEARANGARIIEVLSDDWWQEVSPTNGKPVPNPSADWAAWDSFVKAKVRQSIADGRAPDYWEMWNEPGGDVPPVVGGPLDVETQLALFEHTWRAIKAVDPGARVAYSAATAFSAVTRPADKLLGLPELLDFVRRRGLTLDALTYHESLSSLPTSTTGVAEELMDHAATARNWLESRGMRSTKIVIDEFLPPSLFGVPAANLAYFSGIERSAADGGGRACWRRRWPMGVWLSPMGLWSTGLSVVAGYSGCNLGQLDNLADLGGHHPTAAWWVQHLYSNLDGDLVPVVAPASLPGLATVTEGGTTVVMVGQSRTCTGDVWGIANPRCPLSDASAPPMTVTIQVTLPHAGLWKLAGLTVPNTARPVDALPSSDLPGTVTTDGSGVASVRLSIADGEVHQLTFTPA